MKPSNKEELFEGIRKFREAVAVEKCQCYIGHLWKVVPKIIRWEGKASGY